jgi:hypothetical protein
MGGRSLPKNDVRITRAVAVITKKQLAISHPATNALGPQNVALTAITRIHMQDEMGLLLRTLAQGNTGYCPEQSSKTDPSFDTDCRRRQSGSKYR